MPKELQMTHNLFPDTVEKNSLTALKHLGTLELSVKLFIF